MKIIRDEFGHEYEKYRFGYCEYAEIEEGDEVNAIYAHGFLPYSAEPKIQGRFYMARSARLPLQSFSLSSENRRVSRFFDNTFSTRVMSPNEALHDEGFFDLFLTYFKVRHGENVMPKERLIGILTFPLPVRIILYEKESILVAVVIEVTDGSMGHFWFSAYDLEYVKKSFGMWLMLDSAEKAKERGCNYYYLGTVYGEKALYKTNLEPLEFWDGSEWNKDENELKARARGEF